MRPLYGEHTDCSATHAGALAARHTVCGRRASSRVCRSVAPGVTPVWSSSHTGSMHACMGGGTAAAPADPGWAWLQALMFAMHRAAQDPSSPSSPIVHLLSAGASITATNRSGLSALMIACTSSADILWKMMLRFTDEHDVREALARADVHGNAALHLAARAGCAAVCESLIAHGAPPPPPCPSSAVSPWGISHRAAAQ